VRVISKSDWRFEPIGGNPGPPRSARPPLYAGDDPFELSEQELQSILADARPDTSAARRSGVGRSPFREDHTVADKGSLFGEGGEAPKKKSPFLDDR